MFKSILVPIDLADTDLARPAIATAATLSQAMNGSVRLLNVLPMTPVMLAEYVPADFDSQAAADLGSARHRRRRDPASSRLAFPMWCGRAASITRSWEEASSMKADLIVMTSHRPAMRTYFLGSNAGHVVRYAKCSVLVVRHWALLHPFPLVEEPAGKRVNQRTANSRPNSRSNLPTPQTRYGCG